MCLLWDKFLSYLMILRHLLDWITFVENRDVFFGKVKKPSPNVDTTPITEMRCRQCLPLSVVQLKGKHCGKPHCCNGVVDT